MPECGAKFHVPETDFTAMCELDLEHDGHHQETVRRHRDGRVAVVTFEEADTPVEQEATNA